MFFTSFKFSGKNHKLFITIKELLTKKFGLLLTLIVLISYGQILNMYVWQDDNALMFKLAHIEEKAGYLGPGPFGIGAYKYVATPYIPIYKIFGYNTVPYYSLTLALYILATLVVYKIFSSVLGKDSGMIAGFLYACGYIASDGVIRLFNSVVTSVSVILISLLTLTYLKYYKTKLIKWYIFSLVLFLLSIELAVGRTHYLIAIVIFFEMIVISKNSFKQILYSILRLVPFVVSFILYYFVNTDARTGQLSTLISGLFKGNFYLLYSFISSVTNIVLPDWFSSMIYKILGDFKISLDGEMNLPWILFLILACILVLFLFRKHKFGNIITGFFVSILVIWFLVAGRVFSNQLLNLGGYELFRAYVGGILLVSAAAVFIVIKDFKRLYLLFALWLLVNLIAYGAYNPTVSYESVNRYLAHSFFAFIGVVAIIYKISKKTTWHKVSLTFILAYGLGNLVTSVIYQNNIIQTRSNPVRDFYSQLRNYVVSIDKGEIFFIDAADTKKPVYENAFSVASMPETTAIAWRYGVDRYDLKLFTDFESFKKELIKDKTLDRFHSFFYSEGGLIDTTAEIKDLLVTSKEERIKLPEKELTKTVTTKVGDKTSFMTESLLINLQEPLRSLVPITLNLQVSAESFIFNSSDFPIKSGQHAPVEDVSNNREVIKKVFDYKDSKHQLRANSGYEVSSYWTDRSAERLNDFDIQTFWQADRILWRKKNEFIIVDLKGILEISKLVWINGIGNNTPTKFQIEVSTDGMSWKVVKSVSNFDRIDSKEPQIVEFDPQTARFVKFAFIETLSGDAPAISEIWVVPAEFTDLDLKSVERYLLGPFAYFSTQQLYNEALVSSKKRGSVEVRWLSDKESSWTGINNSQLVELIYDGVTRSYPINIPAGGTKINKVRLSNFQIPGMVQVFGLSGVSKTFMTPAK